MSFDMIMGLLVLTLLVFALYICMNKKLTTMDSVVIVVAMTMLMLMYYYHMNKKEGFNAPLDYKMGRYTGLDVNTDKMPYEGLTEGDLMKKDNIIYHSPVGSPHKLDLDKHGNCHLPSVSGKKEGPNAMFMMAYNRSSPDCCPSTYSNSMGCVCLSDEQKAYIQRGGSLKK